MQMYRGMILRFDPGHHHVLADASGLNNQLFHQRPPDAFALMIRMHINRMLNCMAEPIKGAPVAERGISRDHAIVLADQHRIAHQLACLEPGDAVIGVHGGIVPDGGGMQYSVVIDLADSGAILFSGVTNKHLKPRGVLFTIVVRDVTILHKQSLKTLRHNTYLFVMKKASGNPLLSL